MDGASLAQWGATGVIALGLLLSMWRNGRGRAEDWGSLTTEVKNMGKTLGEVKRDVSEIKQSVGEQRTRCASLTSGFEERIKNLEEKSREE